MGHRDVFISYATQDRPTAEAACRALENAGLSCWIAPRDIHPGSPWGEAIVNAIGQCGSFVLVFSGAANHSNHVPRELARAVDLGLTIILFRIEPVQPSKALSYFVAGSQWLEGLPPPVEHHLAPLLEAVRYQLGRAPTGEAAVPAQLTTRARASTRRRRRAGQLAVLLVAGGVALGITRALRSPDGGVGLETSSAGATSSTCGSEFDTRDWSAALPECIGAAAVGDVAAQRLVGLMYKRGLGIARNPDRARAWLRRAALRGDEEARAKLWEMYGDSGARVASTQPYSVGELVELLEGGIGGNLLLTLVAESCLGFSVDSTAEGRLLAARATSALVAGLRSSCYMLAAGERPSSAQAGLFPPPDSAAQDSMPSLTDSVMRLGFDTGSGTPRGSGGLTDSSPAKPLMRSKPRTSHRGTAGGLPVRDSSSHSPKGGKSLLDAAKKGAKDAAEDAANRKTGELMRNLLKVR